MATKPQIDYTKNYKGMRSRTPGSITITVFLGNNSSFTETIKVPPTETNCEYWGTRCQLYKQMIVEGTFCYLDHFPLGKNASKFAFLVGDSKTIETRLLEYVAEITGPNSDGLAPVTVDRYKTIVTNNLIPEFGHLYVNELSHVELSSWIKTLNVTTKTLTNKTIPLRAILDQAIREGILKHNIFRACSIKGTKKTNYEIRAFSQDEQTAILAQPMDDGLRNMLTFWFFTGLRTSEIFGLKWGKFSPTKKTILINEARVDDVQKYWAKTAAGNRKFILLDKAYAALISQRHHIAHSKVVQLHNDHFIFTNPRTHLPWKYSAFTKSWQKLLARAGIEYRPPRNIRHTYATMMLGLIGEGSLSKLVMAFGHETELTMRKFYHDTGVVWVDADWSEVNEFLAR